MMVPMDKDDEKKAGGPTRDGTTAVHGGEPRRRAHDALAHPIVQTATYTFADTATLCDHHEGRIEREEYGRYGNPTVKVVEEKLAILESAPARFGPPPMERAPAPDEVEALLFASGMNAISTVLLAMLPGGSHVVLTDDCYRRTRQLVRTLLARLGVAHTIVPAGDVPAIEAALRPETRLVVSEAPTNPYLRVIDLPALVEITRAHKVKTLIDATFATPLNMRPLSFGVDLVVHSATKYLGGHNDLLAGAVIGRAPLIQALRDAQGMLGGICDPHAAWLLLRGLKTLSLRIDRHNATGLSVARFLEAHPKVRRVHYPGLESHPDHAVAKRLMRGHGGVVSFEIDGDLSAGSRLVDALKIPFIGPSLGGVESLVEQPSLMSFYELTTEERLAVGIRDDLIRLSCGIEDAEDLIADLEQALDRI
jgi:cystathionine gamma-synthase